MLKLNWRNKLIIFAVVVAIIPIGISGFNMVRSTKDELKSSTNYELISTAGELAQEINTAYTNRWLAPLLLIRSGLESEELGAEEKAAFLSAGIKNIEDIVSLALFFEISPGKHQTAIETMKESFVSRLRQHSLDVTTSLNPSTQEIIELTRNNMTMGSPRYLASLDVWLVTIQLPVQITGAPAAILCAQIEMTWMRERLQRHPFSKNGRIFLIDNTGTEIFDVERKDLKDLKVVQEATEMLRTGSRAQAVTNYIRPTGEVMVSCYAFPLNLQWAIIAEINEKQAYAAVAKMQQKLSWWVLLGLGIAIVGGLVSSRQISKPILKMSKAAEEISSGNFDVKVRYRQRDEIGILARSLANMGKSLKENFARIEKQNRELEEYSKNLEEKVNQRTAELKEKNIALQDTLKKLKETQDQLIVHEKLASLGALTAGIAHEIKNPLNFVNNFAYLSAGLVDELEGELTKNAAKIEKEDTENIQEILSGLKMNVTKITEHGKRADRIVHSMLQHSHGDMRDFQSIDLNKMVEEYVTHACKKATSKDSILNVKITSDYDKSIGNVNINPPSVSQVILNIINNSIYAMTEKSKKAGKEYVPTLVVSTKDLGDSVEVRFRDNGTGIPKKVIDKIFEPFFTTKPTGEGTGLGLSLSYDIITRMHKGELKVNSEEEQFTEITMILPKK